MQIHPALLQVLIAERERELLRSARLARAGRRPRRSRPRRALPALGSALGRAPQPRPRRRAA